MMFMTDPISLWAHINYIKTMRKRRTPSAFAICYILLAAAAVAENERLTVNTLADGGVLLMCAYLDLVEGAVLVVLCVVSALCNRALDTLVYVVLIHCYFSFLYLKSNDFKYSINT